MDGESIAIRTPHDGEPAERTLDFLKVTGGSAGDQSCQRLIGAVDLESDARPAFPGVLPCIGKRQRNSGYIVFDPDLSAFESMFVTQLESKRVLIEGARAGDVRNRIPYKRDFFDHVRRLS